MGSNPTGATSLGDVAQRQEHSLVRRKIRRFESGRPRSPPRNPGRCAGHDDFAAIEVGFEPSGSEPTPAKPASAHGGRGVTASIRGRDPRGSGSNPADRPLSCGRRALVSSAAVTRVPLRVAGFESTRPHPGDVARSEERLACNEEVWVRLPPSPSNASVVSTASTRPLYGRGVGSIPAGGSLRHDRGTVPGTCLVRSRTRT